MVSLVTLVIYWAYLTAYFRPTNPHWLAKWGSMPYFEGTQYRKRAYRRAVVILGLCAVLEFTIYYLALQETL